MKKERKPNSARKHLILSIISLVLVAVFSFGWVFANNYAKIINQALGLNSFKTLYPAGAEEQENRFTSEYDSMEEAKEADKEIAERLTEEGVVLLKNNGALPLASGAKVTILGHSSTNILVCGTGSADINATLDVQKYPSSLKSANGYLTLRAALEERSDVSVNDTVWKTYMNWTEQETYKTNPAKGDNSIRGGDGSVKGSYKVNEVPWDTLTGEAGVTDSFAQYPDAAIVVVSRLGGEMYDLPATVESQGNAEETVNGSGNSLELTIQERELIARAKEQFGSVIVLINSANPLECDFLTAPDSDVDAAAIEQTGVKVIQLHTGGMCHLDAEIMKKVNQALAISLELV